VIVETRDGRTIARREAVNRGAPDRPLTNTDIRAKFDENAARCLPRDRAEAVADAILNVADHSAAHLSDILATLVAAPAFEGTRS